MRHTDGAVDEAYDLRPGGRTPVGVEQAIHAEVAVVLPLAVVAAVGVAAVLVQDRVIDHLPYAAAHEIVVVVYLLPICLCVAGADAHGVGVLAQEIRPVVETLLLPPVLAHVVHHLDAGVHLAAHVVCLPLAVDGALVVDGQGGAGLQPVVHRVGVVIAAGLVAERPHDDGRVRVELVALVQPVDAVEVTGLPLGVVGDRVVRRRELVGKRAVGLEIVLVHDVDADLVRKLKEQGVGRIVGRADRVDVEFPAKQHIPLDFIRGHGVAVHRACVVVVHAVQLELFPVQQEDVAGNLHGFEADTLLHTGRRRLVVDVVQRRGLGVPLRDGEAFEGDGGFAVLRRDGFGCLNPAALDGERHVRIGVCLRRESQGIGVAGLFRSRVDVPYIRRLGDAQQHVTEYAVVAEHILPFEVRSRAPAAHHGQKLVFARVQLSGQVEFGGVVRPLGVADEFPVQVQVKAARDAEEGDDIILLRLVDRKRLAVHADEVILLARILPAQGNGLIYAEPGEHLPHAVKRRDLGRLVGELIADVYIKRLVIPPELPAGGHIERVELYAVRIESIRKLPWAGVEFEIPVAVQAQNLFGFVTLPFRRDGVRRRPVGVRDEIAAGGQLVQLVNGKGVVVAVVNGVPHQSASFISNRDIES